MFVRELTDKGGGIMLFVREHTDKGGSIMLFVREHTTYRQGRWYNVVCANIHTREVV